MRRTASPAATEERVRLLKYLRDSQEQFHAKSILLTTLAGNTIRASDEGTEAVSTPMPIR